MTVRDVYEATGGDYESAVRRFMNESRLKKFVKMFLDDPCYRDLETALSVKDTEGAFRAVHTLKGVCLNMSFSKLFESVDTVTEALRHADADNADDMARVYDAMKPLRIHYSSIIDSIRSMCQE
jgi:HPt (histidine-containing phosphotransfer) domain-containing protein